MSAVSRVWTDQQKKIFNSSYKTKTAEQIADLTGKTIRQVQTFAYRSGKCMTKTGVNHYAYKYSDNDIELVRQLREGGMKYRLIAEKMEMPLNTVIAIVHVYYSR